MMSWMLAWRIVILWKGEIALIIEQLVLIVDDMQNEKKNKKEVGAQAAWTFRKGDSLLVSLT